MRWHAILSATGLAAAISMFPTTATAVSDTASKSLPNTGAVIQANAWNCNVYVDKCDFATSAKALKAGGLFVIDTIVNVATITAHGWSVSLSTSPSGTPIKENIRRISWTNRNTWISDLAGIADPTGALNTGISTCSDASGYYKGVKAFATACT